jgi:hypothetical protein
VSQSIVGTEISSARANSFDDALHKYLSTRSDLGLIETEMTLAKMPHGKVRCSQVDLLSTDWNVRLIFLVAQI